MKKKLLAVVLSMAMVFSMTACGGSTEPATEQTVTVEETAVEETEVEVDEDAELQSALDELAAALDGTCWIGMDAEDYTCYVLGFEGNQIAFYSNIDGDEGVEGYWNIGVDTLYIYDDEECTNQIGATPWSYSEEDDVMILNNTAVMAQVDGDMEAAAVALEEYAAAARVGEYLDDTVWAGMDEDESMVLAFTFKDGKYYMGIAGMDGSTEEYTGIWAMDYDSIYLYDDTEE